jgi:hypothetical protein
MVTGASAAEVKADSRLQSTFLKNANGFKLELHRLEGLGRRWKTAPIWAKSQKFVGEFMFLVFSGLAMCAVPA